LKSKNFKVYPAGCSPSLTESPGIKTANINKKAKIKIKKL